MCKPCALRRILELAREASPSSELFFFRVEGNSEENIAPWYACTVSEQLFLFKRCTIAFVFFI